MPDARVAAHRLRSLAEWIDREPQLVTELEQLGVDRQELIDLCCAVAEEFDASAPDGDFRYRPAASIDGVAYRRGYEAAIKVLQVRANEGRIWSITHWDNAADYLDVHRPDAAKRAIS